MTDAELAAAARRALLEAPDSVVAAIARGLLAFAKHAHLMPEFVVSLPVVVELAADRVALRQKHREWGSKGGQKSGAVRRGSDPEAETKPASQPKTKPASRKTKPASRNDVANDARLDSDTGIGTKPASPPWKRSPIIERRGVEDADPEEKKLTGSGRHKGDATSNEAGFDSRKRPGRPDTGLEHEKLAIGVFHERFKAEYGAKPNWTDGNAKSMRGLVSRHGSSEVIRRVGIMFDSPPSWLSPPYDMRTFVRFFDKFVAPTSAPKMVGASGLTYGRFEPNAKTDYRAPWVIEAEERELAAAKERQ